jgi:hypothetical protein
MGVGTKVHAPTAMTPLIKFVPIGQKTRGEHRCPFWKSNSDFPVVQPKPSHSIHSAIPPLGNHRRNLLGGARGKMSLQFFSTSE